MKKIDYQVERRNSATEIFMSNLKWNALNQLTSQPRALLMLHRWHLSHRKNDGKRTMEVFKTKDYQRSPSLEAQHRPGAPPWDYTSGLFIICWSKKPLWILKVMTIEAATRAQWGSDTYPYNRGADPGQKDHPGFPWGTECGQPGGKIDGSCALHSNRNRSSALYSLQSLLSCILHPSLSSYPVVRWVFSTFSIFFR